MDKEEFLAPRSTYYGDWSPERVAFNQNLQELATKTGYIVALETGGKITPEDAYKQIKKLWKELKNSKKHLLKEGNMDVS